MRILLDECVDQRFAREIPGHAISTVPQAGWAGRKNGELLALAERHFDIFVTVDQNLSRQQNVGRYSIAIVVLRARSSRLADLRQLIPDLIEALESPRRGEVTVIAPR